MGVVVNRDCVSVGVSVGEVVIVVDVVVVVSGIGVGEEEGCVGTGVVAGNSVPIGVVVVVVVFGVTRGGGSRGKFPWSPVRERHIDLKDDCHAKDQVFPPRP